MQIPVHLLDDIQKAQPKCGNAVLLTIDGPAGAGKTTLSELLQNKLTELGRTVEIIHMDDIYDGWEYALGGTLSSRLRNDIVPAIASGKPYSTPRFDWLINAWDEPITHQPTDIVILEGVGSGQRATRSSTSLSIWIDISPKEGMSRVLDRDGFGIEREMKHFKKQELIHFAAEGTASVADYSIDGAS